MKKLWYLQAPATSMHNFKLFLPLKFFLQVALLSCISKRIGHTLIQGTASETILYHAHICRPKRGRIILVLMWGVAVHCLRTVSFSFTQNAWPSCALCTTQDRSITISSIRLHTGQHVHTCKFGRLYAHPHLKFRRPLRQRCLPAAESQSLWRAWPCTFPPVWPQYRAPACFINKLKVQASVCVCVHCCDHSVEHLHILLMSLRCRRVCMCARVRGHSVEHLHAFNKCKVQTHVCVCVCVCVRVHDHSVEHLHDFVQLKVQVHERVCDHSVEHL